MTRHEKEQIIRSYWDRNIGRKGATEGAREIEADHGIPTNTVRGIQNQIYPAGSRPWNAPVPTEPVAECPRCARTVFTSDAMVEQFGTRRVWRGRGDDRKKVPIPQSYCRKCRTEKRRETRRKSNA